MQTAFIWARVIENGKKDSSITNSMDTEQILHYMNLTIVGIIEQTILRKATLKRIDLTKETIKNNTLSLIQMFLTNMKT